MIRAEDYDVLVACECSGRIRDALIAVGVRAISCDLMPTRSLGPHYHGDVHDIINLRWPALIAHPVCKYMTNAGVRWLWKGHKKPYKSAELTPALRDEDRWQDLLKGVEFFNLFNNAEHIPLRAVENPIMHGYAANLVGRRADQFVQPWWFGDPFKKATGFHLTGLPKLRREKSLGWYKQRNIPVVQECWLMGPSEDREEKRSVTYPQVARAVAETWGPIILKASHAS